MTDRRPLYGYADIAAVGALLADATRARMMIALADGRALPASVLAAEAGVAASTASEHLARLVEGGLLTVERSGRHRYYRIANSQVGAAIEALAVLAPTRPVRSLRESTRAAALRRARS
ncbi:ArsR/SmtB family transcription factor, partial [Nocardia cerradoensis]